MDSLRSLFLGIERDPQVVAATRALLLYGVPLLGEAAIGYLAHVTDPRWLGLAGATVVLLRAVEGAIDRNVKPTMNQADPTPVAGGADPALAPHGGKRGH